MFKPGNRFKSLWDKYIIVLIVLSAVEIPARLALNYKLPTWLLIVDLVVSVSFFIDVVLNFFTSVVTGMDVITDRKQVAKRYLKGWFSIDLLASIPFELLLGGLFSHTTQITRMIRLLRITRMLKLGKITQLVKGGKSSSQANQSAMRLVSFMFWILLLAHWFSCIWVMIGGSTGNKLHGGLYLDALYWCITTLATVGYGDISPTTPVQGVYTMIIMFLGVGIYGYVIGNITTLIANLDVPKRRYEEKMEDLNSFFKIRNIPIALQTKINRYYNYLWVNKLLYDETTIMKDLPIPLRESVSLHINSGIINKVPLFQNATDEFKRELCMAMKMVVYTPGDPVMRRGEMGEEMFFISKGQVDVMDKTEENVIVTLSEGAFFGELALILSQPRNATIKTQGFCDLYMLDKKTFNGILSRFPDFEAEIKKIIEERMAESK